MGAQNVSVSKQVMEMFQINMLVAEILLMLYFRLPRKHVQDYDWKYGAGGVVFELFFAALASNFVISAD